MNIRQAQKDDWPQVWNVLREAFHSEETYVYFANISEEDAYDIWIKKSLHVYVVEQDQVILGTYYIKPNQQGLGSHICNCGYISASQARGKGVGSLMCKHSLEEAKKIGFLAMQYNLVVSTNEGAIRLWKKFGFEIVGTIPQAFYFRKEKYVDAHIMYKKL
ncbi:N-acetyltransferase family protein [Candidatus Uabimicrobium sp. HlEnr_7]|uniref:GNAT family N-acetyltransferase n=1 Tax=Candidatus Uabimicrobium helgolandensis TaxID=3095367 RepID=UPI003557BC86